MLLVFAILLIIILVVLVRCIVIVPQSNAYVTEWLGVYKDTWGAGLHIRTPFVERISRKVSLKEEAAAQKRKAKEAEEAAKAEAEAAAAEEAAE